MNCPKCQAANCSVIDSRPSEQDIAAIRRRRVCAACGFRFTTFELFVDDLPGARRRIDGHLQGGTLSATQSFGVLFERLSTPDAQMITQLVSRLSADPEAEPEDVIAFNSFVGRAA